MPSVLICVALVAGFAPAQTGEPPGAAHTRFGLQAHMNELKAQAEVLKHAKTNARQAQAWLALNRNARQIAQELNTLFPQPASEPDEGHQIAQAASSSGVTVGFSEIGSCWSEGIEGYSAYLKLWPAGPDADEAT